MSAWAVAGVSGLLDADAIVLSTVSVSASRLQKGAYHL